MQNSFKCGEDGLNLSELKKEFNYLILWMFPGGKGWGMTVGVEYQTKCDKIVTQKNRKGNVFMKKVEPKHFSERGRRDGVNSTKLQLCKPHIPVRIVYEGALYQIRDCLEPLPLM